MKVIDNILLEWSYKCPDGIVDLNDPDKVKILFEILKPYLKEDIDDDILNVLTNIDNVNTKEKVLKYLQKLNKKEDKIEDEVEDTLEKELKAKGFNEEITEYISLLASKYEITDELKDYLKSNQLLSLSDLGTSGNLYDIIKTKTDFPEGFIKRIMTYTPSEGNKALGIGEIALALFFDAKKQKIGDIEINGKTIELKGSGARFPGTGTGRSGDISSLYQDFNNKYPNIKLGPKSSSLAFYISQITKQDPNSLNFINDELNKLYPNAGNNIKLKNEDISDIESIKNVLFKKYIDNYVKAYKENDYYMLISKITSDYELYTSEELVKAASDGTISFISTQSKSNSYPQLDI